MDIKFQKEQKKRKIKTKDIKTTYEVPRDEYFVELYTRYMTNDGVTIPAARHLTVEHDGLLAPWTGRVWCNPPYGSETGRWIQKFVEHGHGIALVFSRTDTKWFHDFAIRADAMLYVRGRIQFIRSDSDGSTGKSGCGAASLLLACGHACVEALKCSNLGLFVDLKRQRDHRC